MSIRFAALLTLAAAPAFCQNWNARLAEQYMDSRQKEWVAWPIAQVSGVACVSCHSGLPYLVSRPALRQSLGEKSGPTLYEDLLVEVMRATVFRTDAKELFGGSQGPILSIKCMALRWYFPSVVLAMEDAPRGKLSPEGEKAFERMWSIQLKDGAGQGSLAVVRFRSRSLGNEGLRVLWRGAGALWRPAWLRRIISRARRSSDNVAALTAYLRAAAGKHAAA